jgi:hypothetical protein
MEQSRQKRLQRWVCPVGQRRGPPGKDDFGTPNNGEHGVPFYTLCRFVRCLTQSREDID